MHPSHDSHYKLLFSHPELVKDLLVEFIPILRPDHLRLDTLQRVNGSYTSESGENRRQDIVWRVCLHDRWLYVYLLLEFQSSPDRWMALRMHAYISLLLQDLQRQNQLSEDRKLPPVLPVVLYNGVRNWDCGTELADLIANAPGWLQPLQPAQRYLVVDAGVHSHEGRDTKSNLVAALFRLEHSRTPDDLKRVLRSLNEWLADPQCASLRRDFSLFASWQLRRRVNDRTIPETADLREIHGMLEERQLDWWEQWKLEGIQEGKLEGKREGKREGKLEGILEGKLEGILEGMRAGKRQGILEGEARLLQLILAQRFGPLPVWADERLTQATESDLARWAKDVLDPTLSLEELLTA